MAHGRPRVEEVAAIRTWVCETRPSPAALDVSATEDGKDRWAGVTTRCRTATTLSAEDPGGAIMSARALVSGACKRILTELGHLYDEHDDLRKLCLAVTRALGLLTANDRREALLHRVIGKDGVADAEGLSDLSRDSDTDGQARQLDARIRHTQRTIDAASALVLFLVETHLADRA